MRWKALRELCRSGLRAFQLPGKLFKQRPAMTAPLAPPCGRFDGPLHRYAVRVYHEDTDATGVVYHASYMRWFERARSDILALLGIDQQGAIEMGNGHFVVSEMAIRFLAPARLGESVIIETRCEESRAASLRMTQAALREGTNLCEAKVRIGFVGPDGRARRQPDAWRRSFAPLVSEMERQQ